MNKYDFTKLVKDPKSLGAGHVEALKQLVQEFPYFSIGQNLLVKALHQSQHYEYEKYLEKASLASGDRTLLYNLVHDLPLETIAEESKQPVISEASIKTLANQPLKVRINPDPIHPPTEKLVVNETPEVHLPVQQVQKEVQPVITHTPFLPEPPLVQPEIIPVPVVEPQLVPVAEVKKEESEPPIQLMRSEGKLVKYVPEPTDNSLIADQLISAVDDTILKDFDIDSLDASGRRPQLRYSEEEGFTVIDKTAETKPTLTNPEPTQIFERAEEPLAQVSGSTHFPVDPIIEEPDLVQLQETVIPEVKLTPVDVVQPATPIPTLESVLDFVEDESAPMAHETGDPVVEVFVNKQEVHHNKVLSADILALTSEPFPAKEEDDTVPAIVAETVVAEPTFSFPASDWAEKPALNLESVSPANQYDENNIAEENAIEFRTRQVEQAAMLQSLMDYEANEYLSSVYPRLFYAEDAFIQDFESVYGPGKNPRKFSSKRVSKVATHDLSEPIFISPEDVLGKIKREKGTPSPIKVGAKKPETDSLVDKFLKEAPAISRPKTEFYSPFNMAKQSAEESEELVSETLAQIYSRQGLSKKAIHTYEKLILLYPNKKAYFASLIDKIKASHNSD